jgi:hypothetical protein
MFPLTEILAKVVPLILKAALLASGVVPHIYNPLVLLKKRGNVTITLFVRNSFRYGQPGMKSECRRYDTNTQEQTPDPF